MLLWSLGQEDTLEEGMTTQSGILAWYCSSWTEEPGGLQSTGCKELVMTEVTSHSYRHIILCKRHWGEYSLLRTATGNLPVELSLMLAGAIGARGFKFLYFPCFCLPFHFVPYYFSERVCDLQFQLQCQQLQLWSTIVLLYCSNIGAPLVWW